MTEETNKGPLIDANRLACDPGEMDWATYQSIADRLVGRFNSLFQLKTMEYIHPVSLQPQTIERFRQPYAVRVSYSDWGKQSQPVLVCCGGVANSAMRFNYLAADLQRDHRVICMDWVGRGLSGWMAEQHHYSLETCVEQLRQLLDHLQCGPVYVLGSSLGGSVAIELASRYPDRIRGMILNDIGPYIPRQRRQRRAETLARYYVFRTPQDLLRRVGVSQRNDGPIREDIRFSISYYQTRWSEVDGGRVYRHDIRAMQAYRQAAQQDLDQWQLWQQIDCPILLVHGLQSDALMSSTIERMQQSKERLSIMHVPDTGHTPVLCDRYQTGFVREWLRSEGQLEHKTWCSLHAPPRIPYGIKEVAKERSSGD